MFVAFNIWHPDERGRMGGRVSLTYCTDPVSDAVFWFRGSRKCLAAPGVALGPVHDAINRYNSQSRFLTAFIEPGPDADGPYLRLAYHCSYPDGVTFAAFQTMAATVTVDCFSFCELIRNRALNTLSKLDQEGLNTAPRLVATRRNPSSRTTLALNMITPVLPAMPRV